MCEVYGVFKEGGGLEGLGREEQEWEGREEMTI